MLKNHLKLAFRHLTKNRFQNGINILGLSIGMAGALVAFLILQHQLNFDHFHSGADRIYRIVQHTHTHGAVDYWSTTAYPLPAAMRDDFPGIKVTQTAGPVDRIFSVENALGEVNRFEEKHVLFVDANYLDFFDFNGYFPDGKGIWLQGDPGTAFQNPESIVITEATAERYFGADAPAGKELIGKTMYLNNKDALTVTGVLRNPPDNTNLLFDLLIPYEFFRRNNPYFSSNWSGNYQGTAFVSLPEHIKQAAFETDLNTWKKKYLKPEDVARIEYRLQALSDIHLDDRYDATPGSYTVNRKTLWGLALMAVFLLLIGCINFINLATARMSQRAKEVGVTKVLGGAKGQLRRQFLLETYLLSMAALLLSFSLSGWVIQWLNDAFSLVEMTLDMTPEVYLFGLLLMGVVGLLAGWYPSLVLSNLSPIQSLKAQVNRLSPRAVGLRQGLIITQFGIVFLLVIGTLVVSRQMALFLEKDPGFAQNSILTIDMPGADTETLTTFRNRLLQHPGIETMSYGTGIPMTNDFAYGTDFRLPSEAEDKRRAAEMKVVDLHYLDLYNLELTAGKWLSPSNIQEGFNGFIANETLVKELGLTPEEAVGVRLVINEGEAPIIGVVEDFNNNPLKEGVAPCLLFYWNSGFFHLAGLKLTDQADIPETLAFVRENWREMFPEAIFEYSFVDHTVAGYYRLEHFILLAFRIFSLIAVFIGCIGLYGLMAFTVETRTKEIGIRKVLGASVANIVGLLSKDFLLLVLIAFLISSPLAYYFMSKWLQNFAYRIDIPWWLFVLAGVMAVGIAFLAVSFQSVKAALANPVESLRSE